MTDEAITEQLIRLGIIDKLCLVIVPPGRWAAVVWVRTCVEFVEFVESVMCAWVYCVCVLMNFCVC
jgi:hypothetical protein